MIRTIPQILLAASVAAALLAAASNAVGAQDRTGVGTDTPTAAFHVLRSDGTAQVLVQETSPTPMARTLFKISNNGPTRFQIENTVGGGSLRFNFALNNAGDFVIDEPGDAQNPEFLFEKNGNLTIKGDIFTTTCAPCVSDYVFEPGYELRSLRELEAYIQEHRHLPNVPSEAQLQAEGRVPLHHLSVRMLEKIEELVLYTLQQQKEIDELRVRLAAVERRR